MPKQTRNRRSNGLDITAIVAQAVAAALNQRPDQPAPDAPITLNLGNLELKPNGKSRAGNAKFNAKLETNGLVVFVDAYRKAGGETNLRKSARR
jgi:hypothetical protein